MTPQIGLVYDLVALTMSRKSVVVELTAHPQRRRDSKVFFWEGMCSVEEPQAGVPVDGKDSRASFLVLQPFAPFL